MINRLDTIINTFNELKAELHNPDGAFEKYTVQDYLDNCLTAIVILASVIKDPTTKGNTITTTEVIPT